MSSGRIVQIIGAVIDVEFPRDSVPSIYNALKVKSDAGTTLEVQQQLGDGVVRTIAMGSTAGLKRGMDVVDTGAAISVPVGKATLGPRLEGGAFEGVEAIMIPGQRFVDRAQFAPLGLPPRDLEGPRFGPLAHRRPVELAFAFGLEMSEKPARSRIECQDDVVARFQRVEGE